MPQRAFGGPQPVGVIYNTSMRRPDSALALAALYGFEGKREARAGAVCVVGAGLNTAIYCDILSRFYHPGPLRNGNTELAVGLAAISPLPPDAPMVNAVVERKDSTGALQYARNVRRLADTSLAEAVLRNGVIFNAEAVVVLSGPATYLAKSLDLLGTAQLYKERVKRLVLADSGDAQEDVPALQSASWRSGPLPSFTAGPTQAGNSAFRATLSRRTLRGRPRIRLRMPTAPSGRCPTMPQLMIWPPHTMRCTPILVSSNFRNRARFPYRAPASFNSPREAGKFAG